MGKCLVFIHCAASSAFTKQRFMTSFDDLQKRLMQTCFDFEQDVIDATIDQWRDRLDCVSVLVVDN